MSEQRKVLFIVGMSGAGKSVISEYLQSKGWQYLRFGQATIDEIERRGLPLNEQSERQVREELRAQEGMAAFAKRLWPKIESALKVGNVVADGLYSWSEYNYLKERLGDGMIVVAITAPRQLRYQRLATRSVRPLTAEEAESRDIAEIENIEKGGPIAMADFTLVNDSTREAVEQALEKILNQLG